MKYGKWKYLNIDTETAGTLEKPYAYDLGGAIIDNNGVVYGKFNWVIKEVFFNKMMCTAYYGEKIPQYFEEIANRQREVVSIREARTRLFNICKEYNIKGIVAHNANFDYRSIHNVLREFTNEKYMFPYGIDWFDTLKMARKVLGKDDEYIAFCKDNGYMTKHSTPRPRMTAEIIYRFLQEDTSFIEAHTGLCDVLIEKDIFAYTVKSCPYEDRKLFQKK